MSESTYTVVGGFDTTDRVEAIFFYKMLRALGCHGLSLVIVTRDGNREIRERVEVE